MITLALALWPGPVNRFADQLPMRLDDFMFALFQDGIAGDLVFWKTTAADGGPRVIQGFHFWDEPTKAFYIRYRYKAIVKAAREDAQRNGR